MWDFKKANSQKQKIDGGYQGLGAKKKWRYWMKGTKFHCSMLYAGQIPSRNLMHMWQQLASPSCTHT